MLLLNEKYVLFQAVFCWVRVVCIVIDGPKFLRKGGPPNYFNICFKKMFVIVLVQRFSIFVIC